MKKHRYTARTKQDSFRSGSNVNLVTVYDNEGKTMDQYTIVFDTAPEKGRGMYLALGLSDHPEHPQGFSQFTSAMKGRHLGKKIKFSQLPDEVQRHVIARMKD